MNNIFNKYISNHLINTFYSIFNVTCFFKSSVKLNSVSTIKLPKIMHKKKYKYIDFDYIMLKFVHIKREIANRRTLCNITVLHLKHYVKHIFVLVYVVLKYFHDRLDVFTYDYYYHVQSCHRLRYDVFFDSFFLLFRI